MKKFFCLFVVLFSLSTFAYAGSSQGIQASSSWSNQRGSTLYIDSIGSDGLVTGTYINRAAGYQCQNIPYPVTGWVYGTAITFTTIWQSATESCNSITSWTGFFYQGQIHTLWQLVENNASSTGQILQGSDTFSPNVMKENRSLIHKK